MNGFIPGRGLPGWLLKAEGPRPRAVTCLKSPSKDGSGEARACAGALS